ncbi:hypothetical protein J3P77_09665 [Pseudomonas sp. R1-18]
MPDEPEIDSITAYLLHTFRSVCRARQYMSTMAGVFPLPLSASQINDWLEGHPAALPRDMIDDVVFALDDLVLSDRDEG